MKENFKGFIRYTDKEFSDLWRDSTIVVDANILLRFYKYTSKSSTKNLLIILKRLKAEGRLWIPHQVALEFFLNNEKNMYIKEKGYNKLKTELSSQAKKLPSTLNKIKNEYHYLDDEIYDVLDSEIKELITKFNEKIDEEISDLDTTKLNKDIQKLLQGIVGNPYSQSKIDEIELAGEERYKNEIPPGFKDSEDEEKQKSRTYGNLKYKGLYGDLILWKQIIDKVKESKPPMPIILITEDNKEDWWQEEDGKTIRPHPNLLQEFYNETKENIYIYKTDTFVKNAIKYLHLDLNIEEIDEMYSDVKQVRKFEDEYKRINKELRNEYDELENTKYFNSYLHSYLDRDNLHITQNYIDELRESGISIWSLHKYLDSSDAVTGGDLMDNITSGKLNQKAQNRAIKWIFNKIVPQIERKAIELAIELQSPGLTHLSNRMLDSIADNSIESRDIVSKGVTLLNLISEMEKYSDRLKDI